MLPNSPLQQTGRPQRLRTHHAIEGARQLSDYPVGQRASRSTAFLAILLWLVGCGGRIAPTEFSYGTESEALAVYAVVLPAFLAKHPGKVVLDPQTTFSYRHDTWAACYDVVGSPASVAPALWRSLPAANATPVELEPKAAAALAPDVVVALSNQRDALKGLGYPGSPDFSKTFPGRSLLQVSRIAFSCDEREALVYVWRTSGPLGGEGAVYGLTQAGTAWAITFQSSLGAS